VTTPESRRARVERAGRRLREARTALGLSLVTVAADVDRTEQWLCNVEHGRHGLDPHDACRLARVLGRSAMYLLGVDDEHPFSAWPPEPGALVSVGRAYIDIAVVSASGVGGEYAVTIMDRRTFLTLGLALPASLTLAELDGLRGAVGSMRFNEPAVGAVEKIAAGVRASRHALAGDVLVPHVLWQLRFLRNAQAQSPTIQRRLLRARGAMLAFAGNLTHWHESDVPAAHAYLDEAEGIAREIGDPGLLMYALVERAQVAGYAPATVPMIDQGVRITERTPGGSARGWAAGFSAIVYGQNGDRRRMLESIERMYAAVDGPQTDALWFQQQHVTPAWARGVEGQALERLGDPAAIPALRQAIADLPTHRRPVAFLSSLARAMVRDRAIDEGCAVAAEVVTGRRSGETVRRIRALYATELAPHRSHPAVRDLGERLAVA
jgi:Helix-turn-helix domain